MGVIQLGQPVVFRPGTAHEERWGPGQYLSGMVTSVVGDDANLIIWPAGEYPPYYESRVKRDDALAKPRSWTPSVNEDTAMPEAPSDGVTYGRRNQAWTPVSGGGGGLSAIVISDTIPAQPLVGMAWLDTTINNFFIYFQDRWVEPAHINPTADMIAVNAPLVTGAIAVGSILTCTSGDWSGTPINYAYQWYRDTELIVAAGTPAYTILSTDIGHDLHCKVTATNSVGAFSTASSNIIVVKAPINSVAPAISGAIAIDSTLVCSDGTWTGSGPLGFAYQWRKNGASIVGAITNSYVIVAGDMDANISCSITASNLIGSTTVSSQSVLIAKPSVTTPPVISGTALVASVLSTTNGVWANLPTGYTYQWMKSGAAIPGATNNSYIIMAVDATHILTCVVTATNALGSTASTSNGILIARPTNITPPLITLVSGAGLVFSQYSCSNGTWADPQPSFAYQWYRDGITIAGQTANTYNTVGADMGHVVTCLVMATSYNGSTLIYSSNNISIPLFAAFDPASFVNAVEAPVNALSNVRIQHTSTAVGGAKTITFKAAGKFCLSFDLTIIRGAQTGCGFLLNTGTIADLAAGQKCIVVRQNLGEVWANNVATPVRLGGLVDNDDIHWAIDFDNHLFWVRRNNNPWNNNVGAVPGTSGGVSFIAGSYTPAICWGGPSTSTAEIHWCVFGATGGGITAPPPPEFIYGWPV